jgi:hypothetical protein
MKNSDKGICFFCLFASFVILYVLYFLIENNEDLAQAINKRSIKDDGFTVFHFNNYYDIRDAPSKGLMRNALEKLPEGYKFVNYSYRIKMASPSYFHRDATSSQKIYKTVHPVYTLILYKYDGCLLSLCPGSNHTYPFVYSQIVNIYGTAGTCVLFDCETLHAGCINKCAPRNIIQYKIVHEDDLVLLRHLDGVDIEETEGQCEDNLYNHALRKCSYFFEFPINTIFYPLMIKQEKNGIVKDIQKHSTLRFYADE